jgi:hypothetical protein
MRKIAIIILVLAITSSACLKNAAPVLSPTGATAIANGLTALSTILQGRGLCPANSTASTASTTITPCQIIVNLQQAISQDASGTTWGALVRTALTDLYSDIPLSIQNDTAVSASLSALEVILATVGA